jgi:hypothetical protein
MKLYKLGVFAVLPLFLLGCDPQEEPAFTDDDRATEERTHQVGDTETVGLSAIEDSGVSGDARFTVLSENQTDVIVEIEDAAPNATYRVAIHQGTCDNVGTQAHQLDSIETNEQGNGALSTSLNVQLANVTDGNHVVAVYGPRAEHDADADADADTQNTDADTQVTDADQQTTQTGELPVACGDISGTDMGW